MSIQDFINAGYGGYAGWGETEANADFNATGGKGKWTGGGGGGGGGNSVDSILNNAISSLTQYVKKVEPYSIKNPFSFDEALAREASTKEYSPYYTQLLTDYTSEAERTKSRSQEDYGNLLENLNAGKEYYMGTQRRVLDKALKSTNEGYAGRGLFFSGARGKDLADLKTEYGAQTGEYERQYGVNVKQGKLADTRTQEDVNTRLGMYTRDINQEKKTAIEQGILNRKGEYTNQYNIAMQKYYDTANYG